MYRLFFLKLPIFSRGYGNIIELESYIKKEYGLGFELKKRAELEDFIPLRMSDFKGKKHCVLTSLTAIMSFYRRKGFNLPTDEKIFELIKKISSRTILYLPFIGVNVFMLGILSKLVWRYFGYKSFGSNKIFLSKNPKAKRIIKDEIDNERPLMVSFSGSDYQNHTTTCYGYAEFEREGEKIIFLLLNDNWTIGKRYADINKLASIKTSFYSITRTWPKQKGQSPFCWR